MLGGVPTRMSLPTTATPCGIMSRSATVVRKWNLPASTAESRSSLCGLSFNCLAGASFVPDDSVTIRSPASVNAAAMGRSTSGGPAASSIVNPVGRVNVWPLSVTACRPATAPVSAASGRLSSPATSASGTAYQTAERR